MSVEGLLQTAAEIPVPRATVGVQGDGGLALAAATETLGTALGAGRELGRHVHAPARESEAKRTRLRLKNSEKLFFVFFFFLQNVNKF